MTFSVIIPTLNRCDMLADALASVCAQSFPADEYEIIVVDNGSLDETKNLVEQLNCDASKPIRYVWEERPGSHWARNAGAKAACGDILAYIDDDCVVDRDWLANLYGAYRELNADGAGGKILIRWDRDPGSWVLSYEAFLGMIDHGPEVRLLKPGQSINFGNFSIRRSRLFKIGGFNPDQIGDYLIGDGETGLCDKIHRAGWKIVWVPDALVWHCQTVDRNATLRDLRRRLANDGREKAYANCRRYPNGVYHILHWAVAALLRFIAHKIVALIRLTMQKKDAYRGHEVWAAYYKAEMLYYVRFLCDPWLRQVVQRDDWING